MRHFLSSVLVLSISSICADSLDDLDDLFHEFDMIVDVPASSSLQSTIPSASPKNTAVKPKKTQPSYGYISSDVLVLNYGYNSLEFGDTVYSSSKVLSHHLSALPRPYNVGVRGDLGVDFGHIGWGLKASGFHYSNSASKTLNDQSGSTIFLTYSSNYNPESPASLPGGKQKGQSTINLNMGDLVMTKTFFTDRHFKFGIDAGFRYVNLHQKLNVYNSNTDPLVAFLVGQNNIKNSDQLSAYGLLLKIHNKFYFTKRFSLDLQGAISGVYGEDILKNKAEGFPVLTSAAYRGSSFKLYNHKVMPIVEFEAQFAYEHSFFDDTFSFKIKAGYLLMDLINAFNGIKVAYVPETAAQVETTSRFCADTFLQGATAGLELRF